MEESEVDEDEPETGVAAEAGVEVWETEPLRAARDRVTGESIVILFVCQRGKGRVALMDQST
jgi:hypothetical protein